MRFVVLVLAVVAGVLLFLLASASENSSLLARHFPLLLALNGAVVVLLAGVVAYHLRKLWREYRARVFGSRLKYRLFLMFALMAVLPGLLVYGVSLQFALKSIESWFDVRVDAALEGGMTLGRNALDSLLADLTLKAENMALDLADASTTTAIMRINRLREQAGVDSAALFTSSGQLIASSSAQMSAFMPSLPPAEALRQARQGRAWNAVEGDALSGLTLRVALPVSGLSLTSETRVLQLAHPVPAQLAASAESVQAVYRDYQELALSRDGLRRIFFLTLTLTLLFALLVATGAAVVLARRLSAPLSILAEGTQAVAQGDFSQRKALPARDELGVLTQSFNRMTRQLEDARALAERSRAELEASRAYLEIVLANLSAGVLTFDGELRLQAANRGAHTILQDELADVIGLAPAAWPRHGALARTIAESFAQADEWQQQVELARADGAARVLLAHGSRLPLAGGGGVVVFDDITQMLSAQRSAAWGEVARRLAHEIKNPLTPIQLSAERLQMKLADKLDGPARDVLIRSTQTIVSQVEAMKTMVNEFRDYARLPPPTIAALDLNALVGEVMGLYEHSHAAVELRLSPLLPPVAGDATQLRQVIHNLLQNAEDATGEAQRPHIVVATEAGPRGADLVVRDNGPGFSAQIASRAFEPYATTKPRGTGLGLAIVKKIIDEHHGDIRIGNVEPHGAEVRIRLPLAA